MSEKIDLEITNASDVTVVIFKATSISDSRGIAATAKKIKAYVQEKRPAAVVFDFQEVKFFSSQVLGILLDTRTKLKENNGKVVISAIEPQLYRVFKITNLEKIFRFFPNKESAVQAIIAN